MPLSFEFVYVIAKMTKLIIIQCRCATALLYIPAVALTITKNRADVIVLF